MNTVTLSLATQDLPAGATFGGYSVVLTGLAVGALPAFLIPPVAAPGLTATGTTPTLQPDTYTAVITNVQADGVTPVPGVATVTTNSLVVVAPTTAQIAVSGQLS